MRQANNLIPKYLEFLKQYLSHHRAIQTGLPQETEYDIKLDRAKNMQLAFCPLSNCDRLTPHTFTVVVVAVVVTAVCFDN